MRFKNGERPDRVLSLAKIDLFRCEVYEPDLLIFPEVRQATHLN